MRNYISKIPKLVTNLDAQKSFEKVLKLITFFSYSYLGNRSKSKIKKNLKNKEKNQFACGSFML